MSIFLQMFLPTFRIRLAPLSSFIFFFFWRIRIKENMEREKKICSELSYVLSKPAKNGFPQTPHNLQQYIHTACKHHSGFSAFTHWFLCTTPMMWSNHKPVSISAKFIKHFPSRVSQSRVNKYENSIEISQQQVWLWAAAGTARGI